MNPNWIKPVLEGINSVSTQLPPLLSKLLVALCENSLESALFITPEVSEKSVRVVQFIVHCTCAVLCGPTDSFLLQLLQQPSNKLASR
jgi:hypothetical protein